MFYVKKHSCWIYYTFSMHQLFFFTKINKSQKYCRSVLKKSAQFPGFSFIEPGSQIFSSVAPKLYHKIILLQIPYHLYLRSQKRTFATKFALNCSVDQYLPCLHSQQGFLNPLNTGGLFHCYMSGESIYHFRGGRSILSLLYF